MITTGNPTDLGSVLRCHRERLGLRREEVAIHVGRSVQALTDYERNRRVPALTQLARFAALFGVSIGELATLATEGEQT